MQRIVNRIVIASLLATSLVVASQSFAAGKLDCSYMKDGKTTQKSVANASECSKLGGKIVTARPAAGTGSSTATSKPASK